MVSRRLLSIVSAVLAVFALHAPTAADVPMPTGLQPGDTYQLIFNSSTFTNALSSNINTYNDFVQAAADAADIGASEGISWKAIASTPTVDARVNAVVGANTPVYNLRSSGMDKVADGFSDMWDGSVDSFPAYNEFGAINTVDPWTGSLPNGLRAAGLTLGSGGNAWCGRPSLIDGRWITFSQPATNFGLTMYALSEELMVPDADFDADDDVDAHDFLLWQRGSGDANGDGTTDADDLAHWTEQYGRGVSGALQPIAEILAVPEPSALVLMAFAVLTAAVKR